MKSSRVAFDNQDAAGTFPLSIIDVLVGESSLIQPEEAAALERFLCAAEVARARRFTFYEDKRDFIAAHATLRARLSQWVDCEPLQLRFAQSDTGKPILVSPRSGQDIKFNITHTRGCIGVAIGAGRECGIDVEAISNVRDSADIRRQILTSREQLELENTPNDETHAALARLWTLKEAFLKARGDGLSTRPNTIGITSTGDKARLDCAIPNANNWQLKNFSWREEFQVSVCFESGSKIDQIDNAIVFLREFALTALAK